MRLVWHATNMIEADWFRYIFGDVVDSEITDLDFSCYDDDSIHVVCSNCELTGTPMPSYEDYFKKLRARCQHIVLVHISDEWFSGCYNLYRYFDLVIRWNHTYLASGNGIVTVPLGYPNNTGNTNTPVTERSYAWSFIGEIKSSRIDMAVAFDGFEPQFITQTDSLAKANPKRLSKAQFDAVLADTVFAPCPMGNATIDTTRVYESLEHGCIPLVELRPTLNYYRNLLGPNPIPAFYTWRDARDYAETIYKDKTALVQKQIEVRQWWEDYKIQMCADVRAKLKGPSHAAELQRFATKLRNRTTLVHEPLRLVEILRHQTANSLMRRISRPRGPLKRILFDLSGGKIGISR